MTRSAERRSITKLLRSSYVWGLDPAENSGLANIHAASALLAAGEEAARIAIESVVSNPSRDADALANWLTSTTCLATLAFCRRASMVARDIRDAEPQKAVALTTAATVIAERLACSTDKQMAVDLVRGAAWREHANCIIQLGRTSEALHAVEAAREAFSSWPAASRVEIARVSVTRANVLFQMERGIEGIFDVRDAITVFAEHEEEEHFTNARTLEACILYQAGRVKDALQIWLALSQSAVGKGNVEIAALLLMNSGVAFTQIGECDRAAAALSDARALYVKLGKHVNITIVDSAVGENLVASGDIQAGMSMLCAAADRFLELGLLIRSAVLRLQVVELLLEARDFELSRRLSAQLIDEFTNAGMAAMATAALSFLKEAISSNKAKPRDARRVRTYLDQHERNPHLLFVPLPGGSED